MRNYIQVVFSSIRQIIGGLDAAFLYSTDVSEGNDWIALVFPGFDPTQFQPFQTQFWIEMNKFNLCIMLNGGSGTQFPFFQTQSPWKTWNSKDKGFVVSPRVDGSIQKPKPLPKSRSGTISISLLTYLEELFLTWSTPGLPPPAVLAPKRWLDRLQTVIDSYASGKMTPTQVYAFLNSVDFSK